MTSYVVLDSGILLKTVLNEEDSHQAKELLKKLAAQSLQIAAPVLLRYEMVAVTRKWVYRELTTAAKAQSALDTLFSYPIETYIDETLLRRGYELAEKYNRPTAYDAQYLALAEHLDCDFWTTDKRLYNAISDTFSQIHWLGEIKVDSDKPED
jgi:predicted nucleic acid-binding protein